MGGFANDSAGNTIVWADNIDFSGNVIPDRSITANGQLLIGSTAAPNIQTGTLTSPSGTLTIGYSSPNITIDLTGGSTGIDSIQVDTTTGAGTNPVLPTGAGLITITGGQYPSATFGTRVVTLVSTAANKLEVQVQRSAAAAAANENLNGVAHFDSNSFAVDNLGFVTLSGGGFTWSNKSGAFAAAKNNGYFITGSCTGTLPAAPSIGDTIKFFVQGAFTLTIQANTGQKIQISSNLSSAAGTQVNTASGDAVELVYNSTGLQWNAAPGFVGAWNFT